MAPTRFAEANGARYTYRRFGSEERTPLVFLSHFRAGLDNWDPVVTDGLASGRPVILFKNAGVASLSGEPADTVDASADHESHALSALWDCEPWTCSGFPSAATSHRASSSVIPTWWGVHRRRGQSNIVEVIVRATWFSA